VIRTLTGGCGSVAAMPQRKATAMVNVARVIASRYIILSLLCGEQKRQNPAREALANQKDNMKTKLLIAALTVSAATAFAGHWVPHIAMPAGIGYATDVKGARHSNTVCVRDALFAPSPRCPRGKPSSQDWEHINWEQVESDGLYRLDIDLITGRVTNVTIVKSGTKQLNDLSILAFKLWRFKPGKWREIIIPTTMRKKWEGVIVRSNR